MEGTGVPHGAGASSYARAAMGHTDASGSALRWGGVFGSDGGISMGSLKRGHSGTVLASGRHGPGIGATGCTTLRANPGCGVGSGASDTACCVGGPNASCWGVGNACFEGAGTMVTTTDLTNVGEGRGNYKNAGYMYVGEGGGNYAKETIEIPYGCRVRPCCLLLVPLLLLPFLCYYLIEPSTAPTSTPTTVPAAPPMRIPVPIPAPPPMLARPPPSAVPVPVPAPAPGTTTPPAKPAFGAFRACIGWGDPHVRTFDGARADYYSSGEYYIVKSPLISIQGRYLPTEFTNGLAVTKMVAIGGSLLKGNKLIIGPLTATWNGAPILTGFPSHFNQPGLLTVDYDNVGVLVDKPIDEAEKKIVHVKIRDGTPEGLTVQVNRWTESPGNEYVNWKISMHSQPGQDGHCGNFNGNAADDDRLAVRDRVGKKGVPAGPELLFATKTPVTAADHPDISDCPTATLEAAMAACKARFGGMSPKLSCLTKYCFVGKEVTLNK